MLNHATCLQNLPKRLRASLQLLGSVIVPCGELKKLEHFQERCQAICSLEHGWADMDIINLPGRQSTMEVI